jgi:CelD/BcsL family acetyltransferase involved in cellulose biosynthesis
MDVLHGWRETHAIPLPADFQQYLQQFSAKKRFNLNRQIRQLRDHGNGQLQLNRIELPEQVAGFIAARNMLADRKIGSEFLSEEKFFALAEQGLLLSYVLLTGGQPCAVILATRSEHILHIHNIFYLAALARLSVGTSALHLAIEDLTTNFDITSIDLGYSNPSYSHQSSNTVEIRGHVLLFRKTWRNRILCLTHRQYVKKVEMIKTLLEKYRGWVKRKKIVSVSSKQNSLISNNLNGEKSKPQIERIKK